MTARERSQRAAAAQVADARDGEPDGEFSAIENEPAPEAAEPYDKRGWARAAVECVVRLRPD